MLHDGHGQQAYSRIVAVAPPHFLGVLRQAIKDTLSMLIGAALDQDYLHLGEKIIHPHLDQLS